MTEIESTIGGPSTVITEIGTPAILRSDIFEPAPFITTLQIGQGPRGPAGTGESGGGAAYPVTFEKVATASGAQTLQMPVNIVQNAFAFRINGLVQSISAFSVSGRVVTLPLDLNIGVGDLLAFDYYPSV